MRNRTNAYPDWAEKYREKGKTIRKTKYGYALYHCTSEYVQGGRPKLKQTYLGMITEEDGFIPKKEDGKEPSYIEYGFSHFLKVNFKRDVSRSVYALTEDLFFLGIIRFIFGSVEDIYIHASYLTYGKADVYCELSRKIAGKKIDRVSEAIQSAYVSKVPDEQNRMLISNLLLLNVVEAGPASSRKPRLPQELGEIFRKYGLRYS